MYHELCKSFPPVYFTGFILIVLERMTFLPEASVILPEKCNCTKMGSIRSEVFCIPKKCNSNSRHIYFMMLRLKLLLGPKKEFIIFHKNV